MTFGVSEAKTFFCCLFNINHALSFRQLGKNTQYECRNVIYIGSQNCWFTWLHSPSRPVLISICLIHADTTGVVMRKSKEQNTLIPGFEQPQLPLETPNLGAKSLPIFAGQYSHCLTFFFCSFYSSRVDSQEHFLKISSHPQVLIPNLQVQTHENNSNFASDFNEPWIKIKLTFFLILCFAKMNGEKYSRIGRILTLSPSIDDVSLEEFFFSCCSNCDVCITLRQNGS